MIVIIGGPRPTVVKPRLVSDESIWSWKACMIDTKELVTLRKNGLSLSSLAGYFKCSKHAIANHLKRLGEQ